MLRAFMLLLVGLTLSACEQNTHDYRYRLTLYVDDNGREVSGSSVVQVHEGTSQTIDDGELSKTSVRGQATVVDLGNGRVLCALLNGSTVHYVRFDQDVWSEGAYVVLADAYGLPFKADTMDQVVKQRGAREIQFDRLPMLVASADARTPAGFQRVDPDALTIVLGSGVRLARATIEITDDPVSRGITRQFPWLAGLSPASTIGDGQANLTGLTADFFLRGVK